MQNLIIRNAFVRAYMEFNTLPSFLLCTLGIIIVGKEKILRVFPSEIVCSAVAVFGVDRLRFDLDVSWLLWCHGSI